MLNSSCQFWNAKSIPLQILHYSSLSWYITPLQILRSYLFYFGQKDPIKVPILTLSSALVKISQISQVFFQITSQSFFFFSKFAYLFSVMKDNSSVLLKLKQYILSSQGVNENTKFLDFLVLGSHFVKFLMPILKQKVSSSSIFVSFFIVMTHNSSVNFKVIHFLLWTKGSHQSSNFGTFECVGENWPNSSCQFQSNKSVVLQILHHSSISWKITPLYFFSSSNIYFAQKEPIKVKISETFECSGQNFSNSLCQFWNNKSIPLQILYSSSVSRKITPVYFFSSNNLYFVQKETIKAKTFKTFECSGQNLPNYLRQFWNDK